MQNKITVLSSCHKRDVLVLVIIRMGVLQDTLPIFYFKALPTKDILRQWRVFASDCLYTVLFKDFQCLDLYNSVIANKTMENWRRTGEQPRNGNSGLTQNPVGDTLVFVAISYFTMAFGSLSRP